MWIQMLEYEGSSVGAAVDDFPLWCHQRSSLCLIIDSICKTLIIAGNVHPITRTMYIPRSVRWSIKTVLSALHTITFLIRSDISKSIRLLYRLLLGVQCSLVPTVGLSTDGWGCIGCWTTRWGLMIMSRSMVGPLLLLATVTMAMVWAPGLITSTLTTITMTLLITIRKYTKLVSRGWST